ncbi:septum formation initiator [Streptomyces capparidis]
MAGPTGTDGWEPRERREAEHRDGGEPGQRGSDGRRRPPATERAGSPLIVTEDEQLLDDLLRLCAAAGTEPEVAYGAPPGRASWERAPLVLVGDESAARVSGPWAGVAARRGGVLLIGRDLDDPDVWRRAVDIGADHVLFLPDAEQWLVDRIADAAEGVGRQALTVAVLGGRGGAGASTLACALAVTAARSGQRAVLVDGDPLGGGLDALLGTEDAEGLRWPDLTGSRGRVSTGVLDRSLPRSHKLAMLSWDRRDAVSIPPEAMRSVLAAVRRRGGLVVVDLPRRVDDSVAEALSQTDLGLLVVPSEVRAVVAAGRVAAAAGMVLRDLRVVVRGPVARGLDDEAIAETLGLRLAGQLPPEPGLAAAPADGQPPGGSPQGPLARFCSAFLAEVLPPAAGSVAA